MNNEPTKEDIVWLEKTGRIGRILSNERFLEVYKVKEVEPNMRDPWGRLIGLRMPYKGDFYDCQNCGKDAKWSFIDHQKDIPYYQSYWKYADTFCSMACRKSYYREE